jgi:cellulose synthase/poly-beta-1,6-N-acetylglucosamine synthase-like glycosyltransferase
MEGTRVSVIINKYNYARFLRDAIESALRQTHPSTEVVVVDDGSTDHSREIIAEYAGRVTPVLKENGGRPRPATPASRPAGATWLFSPMPTTPCFQQPPRPPLPCSLAPMS